MGHPLQIIRVKKVTGNLNFLWLIKTPYSKMLAILGPVYREVEDFGGWGNPLRWDNPPVHAISHFNLNQKPGPFPRVSMELTKAVKTLTVSRKYGKKS